ncbi:hypothetical protein GDO81_018295 [Engystomops pustulosus]|uniref:Uncharacterized protein n=1 Tax=Engystomops pustulosus TaxID=76066 RepID=A0AAV7ACG6_ENGPU|nr:hypothetical protein GDO81_018295 [Engystomops pustulosus]
MFNNYWIIDEGGNQKYFVMKKLGEPESVSQFLKDCLPPSSLCQDNSVTLFGPCFVLVPCSRALPLLTLHVVAQAVGHLWPWGFCGPYRHIVEFSITVI